MNHFLSEIIARYGLRKSGARWVGPCPKCGGSKATDKFQLFQDGGFRCYACDFRGDRIKWLREMEGKSCPEAHIEAGLDCKAVATCPAKDTCRLGSGNTSGVAPIRKGRTVTPPPPAAGNTLPVIEPKHPNDRWLAWATELLGGAMINLAANDEVMSWLSRRGIDGETARRFCLGWLDHDRRVDRQSLGLSPQREGKTKLWVPGGLVIPIMTGSIIHRLRIRRTDEDRTKFLPNRKYVWVEGSGNLPMVVAPAGKLRGAVVVEAELDAMAIAAKHGEVAVIAIGSVSGGLQPALRKRLEECPVILVALDSEPGKDGKPGPGPEWAGVWQQEFRQAKYWPVPSGKDPGDYAKEGGDLATWVEAGLPPAAVSHDLPLSPECPSAGGEGKKESSFPGGKNEGKESGGCAANESGRPRPPVGDVEELMALLAEANGFIRIRDNGTSVGPWVDPDWTAANRAKRRRITELLFMSNEVAELVNGLEDGNYNHMTLPVRLAV